jgi:hypothetical protein
MLRRCSMSLLVLLLIAGESNDAQTGTIARLPRTTRAAAVARAQKLATHTWVCGPSNIRAACSRRYTSDWKVGQKVTGLPYRWGGADAPEAFDRKIASGMAAGSHSRDGVLSCTAGIDCSGFVAFCWGLEAGHAYSTSSLRTIAGKPKYNWFSDMKPGDALNKAGSHVVLFIGYNPDGTINVCEASGSKARVVCSRTTWSRFKGYIPLQYKGIDD